MTDDVKDTIKNVEDKTVKKTAGQILREARTTGRRKREIATISKQLCIREEFLEALEDGRYDVLPEVVYILGFARNYAMELGLNPDEIVEKIKKELGVDSIDVVTEDKECPIEVDNAAKKEIVKKEIKKITDCKFSKFLRKRWKWFVGGLLVIAAVGASVLVVLSSESKKDKTETVVSQVGVAEPEYKVPVHERFGVENRNDAEVILQMTAKEELGSWVEVKDARGRVIFTRVLMHGDVYYAPKDARNKVTIGHADWVDVWVRGELIPKFNDTRKDGMSLNPDELLKAAKGNKK